MTEKKLSIVDAVMQKLEQGDREKVEQFFEDQREDLRYNIEQLKVHYQSVKLRTEREINEAKRNVERAEKRLQDAYHAYSPTNGTTGDTYWDNIKKCEASLKAHKTSFSKVSEEASLNLEQAKSDLAKLEGYLEKIS